MGAAITPDDKAAAGAPVLPAGPRSAWALLVLCLAGCEGMTVHTSGPSPSPPSPPPASAPAARTQAAGPTPAPRPPVPAPAPAPATPPAAPSPSPAAPAAPATKPPRCSGADVVGVIDVSGTGVKINGQPARDGDLVCNNDVVTTDANSQASIDVRTPDGNLQEDVFQLDRSTDPRFTWQAGATRCLLVDEFKTGRVIAGTTRPRSCMLVRTRDALVRVPVGSVHLEVPKAAAGAATVTKVTPIKGAPVLVMPPTVPLTRALRLPPADLASQGAVLVTPNTEVSVTQGRVSPALKLNLRPKQLPPVTQWQLDSSKLQRKLPLRLP